MSDNNKRVQEGKLISIHYTLHSKAGQLIDKSEGEPLSYVQGAGRMLGGLQQRLEGQPIGSKIHAELAPAEAYGERKENSRRTVPRSAVEGEVAPGMELGAQAEDGTIIPLWVLEADDEKIVVDMNHPLAGHTLVFDVEVVDVKEPPRQAASA